MKTVEPDKSFVLQFIKDAGLANQMFEYAAGRAIAKRTGRKLLLNWRESDKRDFELVHFGIENPGFTEYPLVSSKLGQGNRTILEHAIKAVSESKHEFPAVSHPYQAEECFAEVADEIREFYRSKLPPLELDIPEGRTPVAVQVRRTDYVGHSRLDVVTREYFFNGIDFIRQRITHPQFYVISDDPAWCQEAFKNTPDVTVMPPQNSIEGLRTMVACEAHVISNSTFGWWGAWLVDKLVVVPEIWHHRPGSYGDWKPAPDRWHRVSIGRPITTKTVVSKPVPPRRFEAKSKECDRAIVVPWHHAQDGWQSLRFCLRSIHQHFEDRKCPIYILGTKRPGWLLHKAGRVRFEETWSYQDALIRGVQVADEVMWMNDDILFLKKTGWDDMRRPLHFGEVTPEFLADFERNPNPWRDSFRAVVAKLAEKGTEVIRNYSTHVPYLYKMEEATEILKEFGITSKFPLEMAVFNRFAGAAAKPINGERATQIPFGDARYLNHTDHRLDAPLKEAIKARFPEYAPWELKSKFDA